MGSKRNWKKAQQQARLGNLARTLSDSAGLRGRLQAVMAPNDWAAVEVTLAGDGPQGYMDPWQRESYLLDLAAELGV